MDCDNCGKRYDPNTTGWKCPHCGHKDHCCG
jgi:DNA-directed RNA polymerase subunit RPC12/RpoP